MPACTPSTSSLPIRVCLLATCYLLEKMTEPLQVSLYYLQSLSLGVLTQRKWTNRDIKTPPNSVSYLIFFIVLA